MSGQPAPAHRGIAPGQVAEIIVAVNGEAGWRGSGYRVGPTAVLTAAHVIKNAVSVQVRFDADLPSEWSSESVSCWADPQSDLAVLTIAPREGEPPVTVARFGRIGGDRDAVLTVRAVGFPLFKLKAYDDTAIDWYRDSEQADGSVAVLSNRREGTLEVTVSPPERDPDPATSPWDGMSGAALWVDDRIVGVIAKHHRSDGLGRLAAARLDRALNGLDRGQQAELQLLLDLRDALPDVVPPSAGERVTTAYQAQVRDIAPDQLLDREEELDELVEFCAGDQPYAWWQAGPWAGKSAVMSWFVLHPPAGVDVVSFFVTARLAGQSDSNACIDALIEQLAALVGESPAGLLAAGARRGTLLRLLDDAASRARESGRRLLLAIDGLDEDSGTATGPSIAALLPRRPPPEVRVLVASRPHPPIPDDVDGDHPLRTITPRHLAVSEHARDFEYRAKHELKQLLTGSQLQRDVLGVITTAGGGLTLGDLEELTERPPFQIEHLLSGLFGRSVGSRTGTPAAGYPDEWVYLFTHETLRLVAIQQYGASLAIYRDRLHAWADTWRDRKWPASTPRYLLRSYPRMLASDSDLARLVSCATDQVRHDRMRELTRGDALAFTEIGTAQQLILAQPDPDLVSLALLAVQRDHLVKRNIYIPTGLPAVWAKLGQLTRADALAHSIPNPSQRAMALGSLAEAVVLSGDLDKAEAVIAQITDLHVRANALAKVSRAAGVRGDLDRAGRLTAEIRTFVGLLTDPIAQAGALLALVEATAASGDVGKAQALMGQMIPGQRDWALPALVEAAVAAGDLARAEDLARLAKDPFQRVWAFFPLLMLASDHGAQAVRLATEAEILAGQITDLGLRRVALVGIAQAAARAGDLDRTVRLTTDVETLAEQIIDQYTRLQALIRAIAVRGDHSRAAQLAVEAHALTAQETDLYSRVCELTRLADTVASGGDHSFAAQLATEVEILAAQNFDSVVPEHALAQLGKALAAAGDLERAEDIAGRPIRPAEQASTLLALVEATAAGGDLGKAQALMRQMIPAQQDWALPALVKAAVAAGDLDQAESLVGLTTDPFQKVWASLPLLMATGDHGVLTARVAAEAEILAKQITDSFERAWALTWLAEAAAWVDDVERAARLATNVEALASQTTDPSLLVPTLAVLVRVVTAGGDRDRAARLADEAEALTRQSTNPDQRAWALGRLTQAVAAGGDHDRAARLAADAKTVASQITSLDRRAAALARLAMTLLETSKHAPPVGERAHSGSPVLVRARSLIAEALVTGSWTEAVSGLARVDPLAVRVLADDLQARWGFDSPSSSRDGRAGQS